MVWDVGGDELPNVWPESSTPFDYGIQACAKEALDRPAAAGAGVRGKPHLSTWTRVRQHATVLFTDIEDSTPCLVRMGDEAWARVLDAHDRIAAGLIRGYQGWLVKTTGDGVLAVFSDAGSAVACATRFVAEALSLGIVVRSGLHSGDCLITDTDVCGLTIHIAARVAGVAGGGEVRLSEPTRALLCGAPVDLADCGRYRLKGIPGEWQLFAVRAEAQRYALTA